MGGETEREKNLQEWGKIEREEKHLSVDLLARGVCRVVPVNGWFKFFFLGILCCNASSLFSK